MNRKNELSFFFIMIIAMSFWGGSWISGKLVSAAVHQDLLVFWRFLFCFLGFLLFHPFVRFSFSLSLTNFGLLAAAGVLMILYNQFFFLGLRYGLAGKGGVMVTSLNPVFTFLMGAAIFRYPVLRVQLIGILLGISGGFLLTEPWNHSLLEFVKSGNLYFISAAAVWALLTLLAGRIMQRGIGLIAYNFYLYLFAWLISVPLVLDNAPFQFSQYSLGFWLNIIYLSYFSTTIGATLYFLATRRLGPAKASSFTFLVPVVAVLISWAVLGEVPRLFTILGGTSAMSAVYLINLGRRRGPV